MQARYWRAAAFAAAAFALAFAATFVQRAKADDAPACIASNVLIATLAPASDAIILTTEQDAQRIADALSDRFHVAHYPVRAVLTFVDGGIAGVFGIAADGCANISGTMALETLNEARTVAGLPRLGPGPPGAIPI
jgi:hypothetical protein